MDTVSNIKIRRSIRKYKEDAIPHSLIEEVVETARFAPSWKNTQIVRYVCVEDPVLKQQIADYCTMGFAHNEDIISRAPSLMVLHIFLDVLAMSETALSVQPEVMRGSLLMQVLQQKLSVWQPMKKDLVPVFWEFTMRKRQQHFWNCRKESGLVH